MEILLSAAQMKECDRYTIERIGIPSAVLMERAALSVVKEMERAGFDLSDVLVICGSGNNGGDGFAVARILAERQKLYAYGGYGGSSDKTAKAAMESAKAYANEGQVSDNTAADEAAMESAKAYAKQGRTCNCAAADEAALDRAKAYANEGQVSDSTAADEAAMESAKAYAKQGRAGDGAAVDEVVMESAKVYAKRGWTCDSAAADEAAIDRAKAYADGRPDCRRSARVTVAFVGRESHMTEETARQRKICEACGVKESSNFMDHAYTAIVDAMLGIGLSRNVEGRYAEIVRWINAGSAAVAAVDIPSGVNADTGHILGEAVRADLTVTFARRKPGQLLYPGAEYCGRLVCRQIGVVCRETDGSAAVWATADSGAEACGEAAGSCFTCSDADLARIAPRHAYSNKGSYGKVFLIAGSRGMSGAACLAARAALRSGCGMVRVFTPECNRAVIQTVLPEAIVTAWEPQEAPDGKLKEALAWSDAVGIGPGLGRSSEALKILSIVLQEYSKPLVIDADALNLLAENPALLPAGKAPVIVTPHIGEMSRLARLDKADITADLPGCARAFAGENKLICVLKDARTVVSDGKRVYINTSGNHGMAAAGSGDVLTGLLCGLLGQGMNSFETAVLGVYLHGRAGDLAREKTGAYGMMARELADQIAEALKIAEKMQEKP